MYLPGHGFTAVDSHHDLPVDERGLKDLEEQGDLEPFKKVIKSRVDMIMTAHIKYPNIDPQFPVTLSPLFISQFLKGALRYKGIIITDDLDMKALTKHFPKEEIPVLALQAGATMLLYCNDEKSPPRAIKSISKALSEGKVSEDAIRENYQTIVNLKIKKLKDPVEPFSLEKAQSIIGRQEHQEFAEAVAKKDVEKYLKKDNP